MAPELIALIQNAISVKRLTLHVLGNDSLVPLFAILSYLPRLTNLCIFLYRKCTFDERRRETLKTEELFELCTLRKLIYLDLQCDLLEEDDPFLLPDAFFWAHGPEVSRFSKEDLTWEEAKHFLSSFPKIRYLRLKLGKTSPFPKLAVERLKEFCPKLKCYYFADELPLELGPFKVPYELKKGLALETVYEPRASVNGKVRSSPWEA